MPLIRLPETAAPSRFSRKEFDDALALPATGDPQHLPPVRQRARALAATARGLSFTLSGESWDWGDANLFLAEYDLLTTDETVLPGRLEFAVKTAQDQSLVGTWGQRMRIPCSFADGPRYGIAHGYGAINSGSGWRLFGRALPLPPSRRRHPFPHWNGASRPRQIHGPSCCRNSSV